MTSYCPALFLITMCWTARWRAWPRGTSGGYPGSGAQASLSLLASCIKQKIFSILKYFKVKKFNWQYVGLIWNTYCTFGVELVTMRSHHDDGRGLYLLVLNLYPWGPTMMMEEARLPATSNILSAPAFNPSDVIYGSALWDDYWIRIMAARTPKKWKILQRKVT